MRYFLLVVFSLWSALSGYAMGVSDDQRFVDGLIGKVILITEKEEIPYTKDFKKHVTNELYHIVENPVGKALLLDIVQSFKDTPIIIEAIDINDENERELGPQTSKRMDGKIYVTLYNLLDPSGVQWEATVSNQHKVFGFLVDTVSGNALGDPDEVIQLENPEQHVTLFHELNHARIWLKSPYDNQYECLLRTVISDKRSGTLGTPLINVSTNTIVSDIFGNFNSGMEEFQNIGITSGKYEDDTLNVQTGEWKDSINECSYRLANAKAKGLSVCVIRYPYISSSSLLKMKFMNQGCKQKILNKICNDLKTIEGN